MCGRFFQYHHAYAESIFLDTRHTLNISRLTNGQSEADISLADSFFHDCTTIIVGIVVAYIPVDTPLNLTGERVQNVGQLIYIALLALNIINEQSMKVLFLRNGETGLNNQHHMQRGHSFQ